MKNTTKAILAMKWGDYVLIVLILVICAGLWASLVFRFSAKGQEAEISYDGKVILRVDLTSKKNTFIASDINNMQVTFKDGEVIDNGRVIVFESNDIHFKLFFNNNMVKFTQSDCPDKVCVNTGMISKTGQVAACIPAKILVKIAGGTDNDGLDIIIK